MRSHFSIHRSLGGPCFGTVLKRLQVCKSAVAVVVVREDESCARLEVRKPRNGEDSANHTAVHSNRSTVSRLDVAADRCIIVERRTRCRRKGERAPVSPAAVSSGINAVADTRRDEHGVGGVVVVVRVAVEDERARPVETERGMSVHRR